MIGNLLLEIDEAFRANTDSVALERGCESITYRELSCLVDKVRAVLNKHNLKQSDVIMVGMRKDFTSVALMLAIIRNGQVFCPITPDLPKARVESIKKLCAPVLYISSFDDFIKTTGINDEIPIANDPVSCDQVDAPACIYFTSGSTGVPKGIKSSNAALCHYVKWHAAYFCLDANARIPQLASLSFDASLKDILPALLSGSTVVFPETNYPYENMSALINWLDVARITILQTVPSVIESMCDVGSAVRLSHLKSICLAGELCKATLIKKWRASFPTSKAIFFNLYGATETCILKTYYRIEDTDKQAVYPVGKPLPGVEIIIKNPQGGICPSRVPGQVFLTTPFRLLGGLADNPAFVDDYTYDTGDTGKFDKDGNLIILGRADRQIKINGVRVEPAEIEAVLILHEKIKSAVVLSRIVSHNVCFVAYIIFCDGGKKLDNNELRDYLALHLNAVMIPKLFVSLSAIPVNKNGKLDAAALPKVDITRLTKTVLPRNDIESFLVTLWSEEFGIKDIGVDHDFFQLGGHSLLAAVLVGKINEKYALQLKMLDLLQFQTISGLAKKIQSSQSKKYPEERLNLIGNGHSLGPLSLQQNRLYYLYEMDQSDPGYNMTGAYTITGLLDVDRLESCIGQAVSMHDGMRSYIKIINGAPFQSILKEVELSIKTEDLSLLELADKENALNELITQFSLVPFDITSPPLFRFKLARLSDSEHVLVYSIHHIIGDARSGEIFLNTVKKLWDEYPDYSSINTFNGLNGIDYAIAQASFSETEAFKIQEAYWKEHLSSLPSGLRLKATPESDSELLRLKNVFKCKFPENVVQKIKDFSAESQLTPYTILMAIFSILLYRLSNQSEFVIGTDALGRDHEDLSKLVGFFVNTLPIRFDFSNDETFSSLLAKTKQETWLAISNSMVPFDKIVMLSNSSSRDEIEPFIRYMFRMWPTQSEVFEPDGLEFTPLSIDKRSSKFDLTMAVFEDSVNWALELEFNLDYFSLKRIEIFVDQYLNMVDSVLQNPNQGIIDHQLDSGELTQFECNKTKYLSPVQYIYQGISTYADKLAIEMEDLTLTYSNLLMHLECCAAQIQAISNEGDIIGLYGSNSPEFIVVFLAAFRVGRVVVPINSDQPESYNQGLIQLLPVALIITLDGSVLTSSMPHFYYSLTNGISTFENEIVQQLPLGDPDQTNKACCIFFTSGSTGTPKPIIYNADSISQFIHWEQSTFIKSEELRSAQLTQITFDAILRDIFLPLIFGGQIYIPYRDIKDDVGKCLAWINAKKITLIHTVPSIARLWIESSSTVMFENLRWLFLSGEPLSSNLTKLIYDRSQSNSFQIINLYGPSETLMIKTSYVVPRCISTSILPVGKAIEGSDIFILNRLGVLAGVGEVGEVYIRALYSTNGYYIDSQNDGLFIQNPIYPKDSIQWYKTGDLGFFDANNDLNILGRIDSQIKINGIRIDPFEITTKLQAFQFILNAYVIAADKVDRKQFVAFVKLSEGFNEHAHLSNEINNLLPTHMQLSSIVEVDEIPLLHSGKVNITKLLEIYEAETPADVNSVCDNQESPTADAVRAIWVELLKKTTIAKNDNFFQAGGHSLLATLLVTRLRQAFNISISLREILQNPTIEKQVLLVSSKLSVNELELI